MDLVLQPLDPNMHDVVIEDPYFVAFGSLF